MSDSCVDTQIFDATNLIPRNLPPLERWQTHRSSQRNPQANSDNSADRSNHPSERAAHEPRGVDSLRREHCPGHLVGGDMSTRSHVSLWSTNLMLVKLCLACKPCHPTTLSILLKLDEQMLIRLGCHMPNTGSKRMIQIVDHQINDIGQERDAEGEQIIEPQMVSRR